MKMKEDQHMKMKYLAGFGFGFVAVVAIGSAIAADRSGDAPASTPPGITLIDVVKIVDSSANQYLWRRIGDHTIFRRA